MATSSTTSSLNLNLDVDTDEAFTRKLKALKTATPRRVKKGILGVPVPAKRDRILFLINVINYGWHLLLPSKRLLKYIPKPYPLKYFSVTHKIW